jgi:hypothetical protein
MRTHPAFVGIIASSLLLLSPLTHANHPIPTNGLIGYWPGNGTASDLSPVGNHASFSGGFASGPTGGAFDLTTGKPVAPHSPVYNFRSYDGWSVGFWFNGNGSAINGANGLFLGQDNGSGFKPKWFINYGSTVYVGVNNWFSFHVNDYNEERIFINSQPVTSLEGWNHLVVTIDNTNNCRVSFYLNGQQIGSGEMGDYVLQTTAPLIFGQAEGYSFNGLMSGVAIYNRVLSTNEIQELATIPPLVITQHPSNVTVSVGGVATLVTAASGPSPVRFQWMHNGSGIPGATNAILTITNVSTVDAGNYRVGVTNAFEGILSEAAILTVQSIQTVPMITVHGVPGINYRIQAATNLADGNWMVLTNVVLPGNPYFYIDYSAVTNRARFYEVFPVP